MILKIGDVYLNAKGELVLLTQAVTIGDPSKVYYYTGVTQRGKRSNYDTWGIHQTLTTRADLVEHVPGVDEENFKLWEEGSRWITPGDRIWEVIAFCRDEEFPIIANKLLTDDSFHEMIERFDWEGQSQTSSTLLHKRIS